MRGLMAVALCLALNLVGCGYRLNGLSATQIYTQDTQLLLAWQHLKGNTPTASTIVVSETKLSRHELFGASSEVLLSLHAQVRYPNGKTQHFTATERYPYQKSVSKDHEFEPARARLYEVLAQKIAHAYALNQESRP